MRVSDGQNGLAAKEILMKRYNPEQIVSKLRQADVELGEGHGVKVTCPQSLYQCE